MISDDPIARTVIQVARNLVNAGDKACITGTKFVPISQTTLAQLVRLAEEAQPPYKEQRLADLCDISRRIWSAIGIAHHIYAIVLDRWDWVKWESLEIHERENIELRAEIRKGHEGMVRSHALTGRDGEMSLGIHTI